MGFPDIDVIEEEERRAARVDRVRSHLLRTGSPRLQMLVLVIVTGAVGFLASFVMLRLGLRMMWMRYPASVVAAYAAFLAFVSIWVRVRHQEVHPRLLEVRDARGGSGPLRSPGWTHRSDKGEVLSGLAELGVDSVELPLLLIVFVAVVALAACAYVVLSGPTFLAELLIDGATSAALYRRLRTATGPSWLAVAARRTVRPFLIVVVCAALAGGVLTACVPGAATLGDVIARARAGSR